MSHLDDDPSHELRFGPYRALVAPFGAALRRLVLDTPDGPWDVIWGYDARAQKLAGQGDVLMPFPSRLTKGHYRFGGVDHQLALNDKEGPNAIHGFLRSETWRTAEVEPARVRFVTTIEPDRHRGYPFRLDVEVTYSLDQAGLKTAFGVKNLGDGDAPFGAGFHPYFTVDHGQIDDWIVQIPAAQYLEFKDMVPTGRVIDVDGTPLDHRRPRAIGATRFGHCVRALARDADGYATARIERADRRRRITLRFDSNFDYLVVYSGEAVPPPHARRAFAIEPLTCATDAFNRPDWGLKTLGPSEEFGGHYLIGADVVSDRE